jgi:hypothetical protein
MRMRRAVRRAVSELDRGEATTSGAYLLNFVAAELKSRLWRSSLALC